MFQFRNCFDGFNLTDFNVRQADGYVVIFKRDYLKKRQAGVGLRIFAPHSLGNNNRYTIQKDFGELMDIDDLFDFHKWQWHHVVSDKHLGKLFPPAVAKNLYDTIIPTVLIGSQGAWQI
jgi:hypothetical protein